MSPSIGARAAAMIPSGIREIVNLAIESDEPIVRLEIGEPDFPTPAHVVDDAFAAARRGSGYTQSAGTLALRSAAADRLSLRSGLSYDPAQVIISQGAVQGIAAVFAALIGQGDEVLVPDPAWPNYEMLVTLGGGRARRYPLRPENGFAADPDEVESLITARTTVLVINSPSNPTGTVMSREVIARLVAVAARHGVIVVSDEVYDELIFEGEPANAIAFDRDNVVGVYSLSKTYAMTGWRVGYLAAPGWLAPTLWTVQEPLLSCVSSVTQAAGVAALRGPQGTVAHMRDTYRYRRGIAVAALESAGIPLTVPHGAFYVLIRLAPGVDSRLAALNLVNAGVATAPGSAFGDVGSEYLRISLSVSESALREGIDRLSRWYTHTGGGVELEMAT